MNPSDVFLHVSSPSQQQMQGVTTSPQDSISNSITSAQARLMLLLKLASDLLEQTSAL